MAHIIEAENRSLQLADVLKNHINAYQQQYRLWPEHRKILYDLLNCRTAHLGGHIDRCDH